MWERSTAGWFRWTIFFVRWLASPAPASQPNDRADSVTCDISNFGKGSWASFHSKNARKLVPRRSQGHVHFSHCTMPALTTPRHAWRHASPLLWHAMPGSWPCREEEREISEIKTRRKKRKETEQERKKRINELEETIDRKKKKQKELENRIKTDPHARKIEMQ